MRITADVKCGSEALTFDWFVATPTSTRWKRQVFIRPGIVEIDRAKRIRIDLVNETPIPIRLHRNTPIGRMYQQKNQLFQMKIPTPQELEKQLKELKTQIERMD